MGYSQEACDAERAALARTLETAAKRQMAPERVTIVTDAQVTLRFGAPPIRACPEMRKPTNGPGSRRRNLTLAGWNGCGFQFGTARGRCPYPGPLLTSNVRYRGKKSGLKPSVGLRAG